MTSKNPPTLRMIQKAIKMWDAELRAGEKCPTCGKPKSGIIRPGQTQEQAGLCVCEVNHA